MGVSSACHFGRRWRAELSRRVDHERNAPAPVRTQSERDQTDRILPPVPRLVARKIIDANARLGELRTIIETHRQNCCSRAVPQIDPICFLLRVPDRSQIFCQVAIKSRRLRWEKRRQGVARRLADRRIYGHWTRRGLRPSVTRVTADDRVKRIEHGDVDNRHRPAGAPRPELFSENAVLPGGDRSMIQTAGIYCDHVPTVQ
ncbi:MAG: hypothetical protein DMF73_18875 [Acidobacteria bacterium]|nr:MAG: hypothetical protein DMF73_18875 [Acidobacteriota bacterium]